MYCRAKASSGSAPLVDAGEAAVRWPRFAAAAAQEGIHSFLAAPLFTDEHALGSFNLYGRTRSAFDSLDADIMELFDEDLIVAECERCGENVTLGEDFTVEVRVLPDTDIVKHERCYDDDPS